MHVRPYTRAHANLTQILFTGFAPLSGPTVSVGTAQPCVHAFVRKNTTIMTKHLWHMSAGDLAQAIRAGTVTSASVVRSHLDRIETVNPQVNAVTRVLADEALRAAEKADARLANGEAVRRPIQPPIRPQRAP